MESSPRCRSTDSDNSSTKFRLMCSNGGHILPRPHDKSLCYVGGDTRMVTVDRHTTLSDFTHRLSKTLFRSSSKTSPFTLKYQLPLEDLDSLISVTTDEDLENMIDECERLTSSSSRLRLFIFPMNIPERTVSPIGSFLENPSKSEDWFLNALNGTVSGFSDTSSVTCLLDLNDEISPPEKKDVNLFSDSAMVETTSSFGSAASSTPSSHANFPPIRVNADDCLKVVRGGIEEQFSQLSVQVAASQAPVAVSGSPVSSSRAIREHSDPFLSYHERSEQGLQMGYLKHQQQQQKQSTDSILSDLTITDQSSPISQVKSSSFNNESADPDDTHDQNTRVQMLQHKVHNSPYLSSMPTTQVDSPRHQLNHQQPQFTQPLQYIHHHPSAAVPVTSYYHHLQMDQQNFMYYNPTTQRPPQGYNFSFQQQPASHTDSGPVGAAKAELPAGLFRTSSGGPQLVRIPSSYQNQPQYVGYSEIHQPTQSMYYATPLSATQYQKMTSILPTEASLRQQQMRTAQP